MPTGIVHPAKSRIYHFIIMQLSVGLLVTFISGIVADFTTAKSALLGVLIAIIANVCFAKRAFKLMGASVAKRVVRNLYQAQVRKIIVTVVLFIVCFCTVAIQPVSFFIGYISVQLSHWLAPMFVKM